MTAGLDFAYKARMSTSPNTASFPAPKADFVATRTLIGTAMDARLRILLGWKLRVHVKTPLRVGEPVR